MYQFYQSLISYDYLIQQFTVSAKKYCSNNKFYTFAAVKIFRMKNLVNIVISLVVVVCG